MNNLKKVLIATLVIFILLGFLAFGTFDYDISKNLINKSSRVAEFFNRLGEIPAILGMLIGIAILYGSRKKEKLWTNIISTIISLPLLLLFSYANVLMPFKYAYEHVEGGIPSNINLLINVMTIILFIITLFVIIKVDTEKLRKYRKVGLILVLLVFAEILVVNLVKMLWARPRMRFIESIEQFKYWYEINGPLNDNELKSFPSGHTANSFVMLAYIMFIPRDKKKLRMYFTAFAITWGSLVALSRVILGAHFSSDVIVGGYITILLYYALSSWINIKGSELSGTNNI